MTFFAAANGGGNLVVFSLAIVAPYDLEVGRIAAEERQCPDSPLVKST